VAEPVEQWWARRQFSRGTDVPYPVGSYRDAWAPFPVLIHQYHPEFNHGIVLSQIPPAAEVLLQWQCDAGHVFVATPTEQRERPGSGNKRRRSSWCPQCLALATPRRAPDLSGWPDPSAGVGTTPSAAAPTAGPTAHVPASAPPRARAARPPRRLCPKTPALPVGEAFLSSCAPRPASAIEAELRAELEQRLAVTHGLNAIKIARPFFDHLEVWPDILLPELRVAIEYDTTGRHGLEHVGRRQKADERKDKAIRSAGWEVVRIRTGKLERLGEHDIQASGTTRIMYARLFDELRAIRGELIVDAYLL
jgi:very-short-patch-repair endonuclease